VSAPPPPRTRLSGERLGLGAVGVFVMAPGQARTIAAAAAAAGGVARTGEVSYDESSRSFLESLLRRGRIELDASSPEARRRHENRWARKTHELRPTNGDAELLRVAFDCHGFD